MTSQTPDRIGSTGGEPSIAAQLLGLVEPFFAGAPPIRVRAWDGSSAGPEDAPTVVLRTPNALRRLVWSPGELGLAQAYVTGELDVDGDLAEGLRRVWGVARERGLNGSGARSVLGVIGRNAGLLARTAWRLGVLGPRPAAPASQAVVSGRLHSKMRDRAVIAHHYDLSNEFYRLILDEHMAYSSGYWTSGETGYTVADSQRDKLDLVCRKLDLQPGSRLLDIGCGWGSLSLHAAEHYGAQVIGVTLSAQQRAFVLERIAERGLGDRVEVRLQDYREIDEPQFDAISSIEMGEHVGAANYPVFASALHRLVRPQGRVLIQQMSRRGKSPGGGPFIESFIAPDMHMRPVGQTVDLLEDSGLEVRDVHAMREHYVRTVQAWYETFETNYDAVVALVGEEVARVWRLYLVGGGLAFEQGRMGVDQILAVRPTAEGVSGIPAVRSDLDRPAVDPAAAG